MAYRYCDILSVREDFPSCMTREAINREPKTWLLYYPHQSFVNLLTKLLNAFDGGKTVWLRGAYGSGKTHAALVLQKLFMDDEERVEEYLDKRSRELSEHLAARLRRRRAHKVLAVFDTNSSGIQTGADLIVRLQKGVMGALRGGGYRLPPTGPLDKLTKRLSDEGERFFATRDELQGELVYLDETIADMETLIAKLREEREQGELLSDVMRVLRERDIYLGLTSVDFLSWIKEVAECNGFSKVLYIFDEFSTYVESHREDLRTFEDLAEAANAGVFYFMPVTHKTLASYQSENRTEALKSNDRFQFAEIEMPSNTAFRLINDAMQIHKPEEREKLLTTLWPGVRRLVDDYILPKCGEAEGLSPDDFEGVLPLHPLAAFVLKQLASNSSNVRSLFSFIKGEDGDSTCANFLREGGPGVPGRQYLTIDYLWDYFLERDEPGLAKDIVEIRQEYHSKRVHLDKDKPDQDRVFKVMLIFNLLAQHSQGGSELLQPSVANIKRAFEGDQTIYPGVEGLIDELQRRHCCSVVNGYCERLRSFAASDEVEKKKEENRERFYELVLKEYAAKRLEDIFQRKAAVKFRCKPVVVDAKHCTLSQLREREDFGRDGQKIGVVVALARNGAEQEQVREKAQRLAKDVWEYRIWVVTVPYTNFCRDNVEKWEEFLELYAQAELAKDSSGEAYRSQCQKLVARWLDDVVSNETHLCVYNPNTSDHSAEYMTWNALWERLDKYISVAINWCTDDISGYHSMAVGDKLAGLEGWAKAGLAEPDLEPKGVWKSSVLRTMERLRISKKAYWFAANPKHALAQMRAYCDEQLNIALDHGRNFSVSELYRLLRRAEYGGLQAVPFSCFVMGLVLRHWLSEERRLQWTNDSLSGPLDESALAEMINKAVLNGGQTRAGDKKICLISPEEQAFIKGCRTIFDLREEECCTVDGVKTAVIERIRRIGDRVPLEILQEHLRSGEEMLSGDMAEAVGVLGDILKVSDKGAVEERSRCIKELGQRFEKKPGLASALARHVNRGEFLIAFKDFVERQAPELEDLSVAVGDKEERWLEEVKSLLATQAGWLWSASDIIEPIQEVVRRYKVVKQVQELTDNKAFLTFREAVERLQSLLLKDNRLSLELINTQYPALLDLSVWSKQNWRELNNISVFSAQLLQVLQDQRQLIASLFFDDQHCRQLELLRRCLGETLQACHEEELRQLYGRLDEGDAELTAAQFKSKLRSLWDSEQRNSQVAKLIDLWHKETGNASPEALARQAGYPVDVLFANSAEARSVCSVLKEPQRFDTRAVNEALAVLERGLSVDASDRTAWERAFVEWLLPSEEMRVLGLTAQDLAKALSEQLGRDPNCWLKDERSWMRVVSELVDAKKKALDEAKRREEEERLRRLKEERYSQALSRTRSMSEVTLRDKMLQILDKYPEVYEIILE